LEALWVTLGFIFDQGSYEPLWLENIHRIFSGTVFFSLTLIIGYHGYYIARTMDQSISQTKLLARISYKRILVVSLGLFVLFTLRAVYDFSTTFDPKLVINIDKNEDKQQMLSFIAFFIWEIIPTILVLTLFGQVVSTSLGVLNRNYYFAGRTAAYHNNLGGTVRDGQLLKAEIFNDPKRYDSDDETTPFKATPSPNYSMNFGTITNYSVTPIASVNGDLAT